MVHYILPPVESGLALDRRCPHCRRGNGRIQSGLRHRPISDLKVQSVPQRRMQCPWCRTTWTLRPLGVLAGHRRSRRLEGIGVMLYLLGLSYRGVEQFLPLLECRGGKSSIERDVAAAGQKARELHGQAPRMRARGVGVDGTGAAMAGKEAGILFLVAIDEGHLIGVAPLREEQTDWVRRHIHAHRDLPWKANHSLQHVERMCRKVSDAPADPTHNAPERLIGLTFKIRAKTMRGFKAMHKVLAHPHPAFFPRGREGICDLQKVI